MKAAINSALAQTLTPSVIIVADNDPAHSARAVVGGLQNTICPIVYIHADAVSGPAFARNRGAEQCSTEWIAFLDDDDQWSDGYLETAISLADQKKTDCVFTWMEFNTAGSITATKQIPEELTLDRAIEYGNPGITGSNIVIRKAMYQDLSGFDEKYVASEDIELLLRIIDKKIHYAVNQNFQVTNVRHGEGHLSDLPGGDVANGAALLLANYGAKITWRSRRILRAKMHFASASSSTTWFGKTGHAFMALMLGERRAIKVLLK